MIVSRPRRLPTLGPVLTLGQGDKFRSRGGEVILPGHDPNPLGLGVRRDDRTLGHPVIPDVPLVRGGRFVVLLGYFCSMAGLETGFC